MCIRDSMQCINALHSTYAVHKCIAYLQCIHALHAICTAYQLNRRKKIKQAFGKFNKPYPDYYRPNPKSKNYVMHLDWWYAQSHPAEDFAETFAIWLKPRSRWRKDYKDWPVLKKLEYMDELMATLVNKKPLNSKRKFLDPISRLKKTLGEHYQQYYFHFYQHMKLQAFQVNLNPLVKFHIANHVQYYL